MRIVVAVALLAFLLLSSLRTVSAQEVMATGQVYEAPNQVFKVVFKQPGNRTFARFVSDTLQAAWVAYNKDFPRKDGKAPMGWLTPSNRMEVQIVPIGGGVNAEYKFLSWNGYIKVDPTIGEKDLPGLKITLCHELFHALQDAYSNMLVTGGRAHWWFEASAEWAGLKYGSAYSDKETREEMGRYPSFLSIPIQESGDFAEGLMPYAFSAMIAHAQSVQPEYVLRALNGSSVSSRAFYDELVKAANFPASFPDYIGKNLSIGYADPGLWMTTRVLESDKETRIYRAADDTPGSGESTAFERVTDAKRRAAPFLFPSKTALKPLTARLYSVLANSPELSRSLTVSLRQPSLSGMKESNRAVVLTVPRAPGKRPQWARLNAKSTTIPALGKGVAAVYIAVFNPDPTLAMDYELQMDFNQSAPSGGAFRLQPLAFEVIDPNTKEMKSGQSASTPTSKWKIDAQGMSFDSTKDKGFHQEATWSQPPPSLKQGDSFVATLTLVADGPRKAQLSIGPVGPIAEWEMEVLNPGPMIQKFADKTCLLTIPAGKGRRSETLRVRITLAGAPKTLNLQTGAASGPRSPITTEEVFLQINASGLATVAWQYKRTSP